MLRAISDLRSLSPLATDGEIGSIKDVFFDDHAWVIRYLIVDTGGWLSGRQVLISPFAIEGIDWERGTIALAITRDQVKNSPHIDTDKPVSRQHEMDYLGYYGFPFYWGGTLAWGSTPYPMIGGLPIDKSQLETMRNQEQATADPNLRSFGVVSKYGIEATDGDLGHVDDFLFDEQSWALHYLIVDTRKWLPGRRVLISTEWVDSVNWDTRLVSVDLDRESIRESPEWNNEQILSPEDEAALYQHYRRTSRRMHVQIR